MEKIVLDRIKELLLSGKKPKQTIQIIKQEYPAENVQDHHVYGISSELNRAGKKSSSDGSAPGAKSQPKSKKKAKKNAHQPSDEFTKLADAELVRIKDEIARLARMAAAYDKTNSDFAAHLEGKIKKEQERQAAIEEYLK